MITLSQEEQYALHAPSGSRYVNFRYELLDKDDTPIDEILGCAGRIEHNSEAEIKSTARFSVQSNTATNNIDWTNKQIRPYFRLKSTDGWVEWPLGTYLVNMPQHAIENKNKVLFNLECYDKAQVLKEDKILSRMVIPEGANFISQAAQILNSAGISKTSIVPSNFTLQGELEFEPYTPKLTILNTLLSAVNYKTISFDGLGYAVSSPYVQWDEREVEYEYKANQISVIKPGIIRGQDVFNTPNVYISYVSMPNYTLTSTYKIEDASNPLSTVSRRRNIVDVQQVQTIADQTTLNAYTRRRAVESSKVLETIEFATALMPHHENLDCFYMEYPGVMSGVVIETAWSMDLSANGNMVHRCKRMVSY